MYHESSKICEIWQDLLRKGLQEDGAPWDWTTLGAMQVENPRSTAQLIAKSSGIWAGDGLILALTQMGGSDNSIQIKSRTSDGKKFETKDILLSITASAEELLIFERPFINLAAYTSGIATATRLLVEKVQQVCPVQTPRVALTRKTLPGYRDVAIYGVRAGGGHPHRVSLSGGVLVKENHIVAAGSILNAVNGARAVAPHGLKIEVEVKSHSELLEAIDAKVDGVLLDNFTPQQVHQEINFLNALALPLFVEVSGGIDESTIASYAIKGVDVISVGSITHSVKSVDLSLLWK